MQLSITRLTALHASAYEATSVKANKLDAGTPGSSSGWKEASMTTAIVQVSIKESSK